MIIVKAKPLEENGIKVGTAEDAVLYLRETLDYFRTCSRNLTEEQLRRIMEAIIILGAMEVSKNDR